MSTKFSPILLFIILIVKFTIVNACASKEEPFSSNSYCKAGIGNSAPIVQCMFNV
jgi:hypothetical protein